MNAAPAQGSGGVQSLEYQFQSPHEPLLGPVLVPVWQIPVVPQKPQLPMRVQSLQVEAPVVQGSAGMHELEYQRQSLQPPSVGPALVPVWHSLVASHQPQLPIAVQSPQVSASP